MGTRAPSRSTNPLSTLSSSRAYCLTPTRSARLGARSSPTPTARQPDAPPARRCATLCVACGVVRWGLVELMVEGMLPPAIPPSFAPPPSRSVQVSVTFWGANLRNNYMTGSTYLTVELESDDGDAWTVVANDASWETRLHWKRKGLSESLVTVDWTIPEGTPAGTYRIQHFGYFKKLSVSTDIEPYSGTSSSFKVAA